ncbi:MAG: Peptidase M16C associated [Syntrophus sp. PtaB.Bin001]|nr:MAG: Peptidase M16C associated [Syntrophus sp. PtaB.Bin001]
MRIMEETGKCPEQTLNVGDMLFGFRVLRVEQIVDLRVTAYEIEHEKTGAKLLHLHSTDKENLFSIGFRTPPKDSTGVPHILEHSVLAGSEKYPLKDAFNELVRGTLQTFINAFTYPDKTIYPVASQVKTDFFNLARVYTDLVLHPRLLKETFLQEGHHLEFVDPDDTSSELTISGIVYNEMKGAYSSPETLMYKAIQESLYPDTTYAFDSGGNPEEIPSLTYEQFQAFHRLYYSPSNARIFLYGDIPTAEHLAFLEEMLAGFEKTSVDSEVAVQPRWTAPAYVHDEYPVGKEESLSGKTAINMAWMLTENTDDETAILLEVLSGILIGSAAAPLRKALIDSGLGEDLSPVTGIERDLRQLLFAVGLRGSDPEKSGAVETCIFDTLKETIKSGFDRELIEGVLHQIEFQGKEIVRSSYPYGIVLMGRVYHTWLYDGDPLSGLNFPRIIENIRRKWEKNPHLFEGLAQTWLLDNPHRVLSVLQPSRTLADKEEAEFRQKMADMKALFSDKTLEEIRNNVQNLRQFQSEPDSPEAAASLPKLKVADLTRDIETVPTEKLFIGGVPALLHDLFTNGIAYAELAFDVSSVPEELQPYLPLLGKMTNNMGAAGLSYEEMAKRITLKTGGIGCSLSAGMTADGQGNWQRMIFGVSALNRNVSDAVGIMTDILTAGDLSHEARMRDLLAEKKNGLHAAVVPSGHVFARMAAGAGLSLPAWRDEQWHGRTQLRFVNRILAEFQEKPAELREKLAYLRSLVFCRDRLLLNVTGDEKGLAMLTKDLERLVNCLTTCVKEDSGVVPGKKSVYAGIAIPAQVSYVARVLAAPNFKHPLSPALLVLARHLSNGFLYKHIRVQGGAYGGMCQFDPMGGLFAFLSYRDPRIVETLDVYQEAMTFVAGGKLSAEEMEKAIVGTIGGLDRPMDPSGRGTVAMIRELAGVSDNDRRKFREAILDASADSLRDAAADYFKSMQKEEGIAVYASEDSLNAANKLLPRKLDVEPLV